MANAGNKMGAGSTGQHGAKPAGETVDERLDEFDIADDIKGKNSLAGRDQGQRANQRQAQAMAKGGTDSLSESFDKLDKDKRAKEDLGKRQE